METPGTLRASRWKKDVISSFGSGFAVGCKLLGPGPPFPLGRTMNLLFEFYLAKASAGYFIEELFNLVVFCDFANARLFMWRRQGHLEQAGGKRILIASTGLP